MGLSRHLAGYDLAAIKEDILKPLYEQLVDPVTRRVLGEYYTPDWLATLVATETLSGWDWAVTGTPHVLDPACGSGTFLRAVIDAARAKRDALPRAELLDELLSRIIGIDVHPLAVIIARATYLLAIKDLLSYATRPVTLPVFLANSLNMPIVRRQLMLDGEKILLQVDNKTYPVPSELINHGADYDAVIEDVVSVARAYGATSAPPEEARLSFKAVVGERLRQYDPSNDVVEVLAAMTEHIARLIRARRNGVHGFLLKNHYRPSMLRHYFDYVVGNPPWLTVGVISTPSYKDLVIQLANEFRITQRSIGAQSNTELATVFLALVVTEFLRPDSNAKGARVALVMPRSVFTAKHHAYLRQGLYKADFDVVHLWDLDKVTPLFKIPACVLFAETRKPQPGVRKPGKVFTGRLPEKDLPWATAAKLLKSTEVEFEVAFLGKRSAWRVAAEGVSSPLSAKPTPNHYVKRFRQGAILYPQTLLIVQPVGGASRKIDTIRVRTDTKAVATAKKSTGAFVNHLVSTRNLFLTAAGDHILPFTLVPKLWRVILPTLKNPGESGFGPVGADALRSAGLIRTATWLDWAEAQWKVLRKEGDKTPFFARLDYLGQLSAQASQTRWVVLYTAAGKRPVGSVIDTSDLDFPFVARDRTFWASCNTAAEAHYVTAMLNSDYAAGLILAWMNRGLFGPRDINKRVLDVPWREFDRKDSDHTTLSKLSEELAAEAEGLATGKLPLGGVGRQRTWLRKSLDAQKRATLEELVERISKRSPAEKQSPG